MIVVCDSSPIIALALIDKLELLDQLFNEVIIPFNVYKELTIPNKPEAKKIKLWAKTKTFAAKNLRTVKLLQTMLDAGESEAISLYWERNADYLLIDEKKGRRIAKYNNVNIIGTLGILLISKKKRYISTVKPFLEQLQHSDIRISDELIKKTLFLAEE